MRGVSIAILVLSACDPFVFDDLEDQAGIRALEQPDDYPGRNFGGVLTAWQGDIDGEAVSRLGVTAGLGTPYVVYRAWDEHDIRLDAALHDGCDDPDECAPGAGAALAGLPVWRAGLPDEGRMCILIGAPIESKAVVRCETGTFAGTGEIFTGPMGTAFGSSAVALPAGTAIGVALIGAPDANGRAGGVFRLTATGAAVELSSPEVDSARLAAGRLGETLAATSLSGGVTLVAAGAPAAKRVVVLGVSDAGGGAASVTVHACLDDESTGFGSALAFGDLDSDGTPDLFVGSGAAGEPEVRMYRGDMLPAPGSCVDWPGSTVVACPRGLRDGLVECAGSGFGAALATGDVDGNGTDDLIVGAPNATVGGTSQAGAVFVLGGGGVPGASVSDVLTLSQGEGGDRLGAAVTAVPSHLDGTTRFEPATGAPGRGVVAVFLCSGLPGDGPDIGARCVER